MTTMTVLQVAGIVEGSERLANEIGRAGVTPETFLKSAFADALEKRMSELRSIPDETTRALEPFLKRKRDVYGRLSALLTMYNVCAEEHRRRN